jgi:predicted esterase
VKEHHIRVQRTARYFVAGELSAKTTEIWYCLHGYSQLAEPFARVFDPIVTDTRVIVAPEALSRFYLDEPAKRHGPDSPVGAAWMTREDRLNEIDDYVRFLDAVAAEVGAQAPNKAVTVLGFSQGVATATRWTALGEIRPVHIVLWGGAIAADLPITRGASLFYGAKVTFVGGTRDIVVPIKYIQRERATLEAIGVTTELVEYEGPHALNSEALQRLAKASA